MLPHTVALPHLTRLYSRQRQTPTPTPPKKKPRKDKKEASEWGLKQMRNKLQGAQKRIDSDENKSHLRKAGKPPRK